jgi:hypothetical protein
MVLVSAELCSVVRMIQCANARNQALIAPTEQSSEEAMFSLWE